MRCALYDRAFIVGMQAILEKRASGHLYGGGRSLSCAIGERASVKVTANGHPA